MHLSSLSEAFVYTGLRGKEVSFTAKLLTLVVVVVSGVQVFERKRKDCLHR
jgi:hypothetical protein